MHWRAVPKVLQKAVWDTYREGQCDDKRPSGWWHLAADYAIMAVRVKERHITLERAQVLMTVEEYRTRKLHKLGDGPPPWRGNLFAELR
jgi:hypothetical protein